ncbi:MAG: amidase, partial [Deinococcus-Thermus bacterium]|nr:amidase [Deinococcota bacterium]
MGDWKGRTAAELGRGIEAGAIDPVELTEAFLAAIRDHADASRIYA